MSSGGRGVPWPVARGAVALVACGLVVGCTGGTDGGTALHGRDDDLVPVGMTTDYAAALTDGGHEVTVDLLPGVGHCEVIRPEVSAAAIVDWIAALP